MDWNIDKYRSAAEPEPHWNLKRDFMESIKHMFDEQRVVCLAQVLGNIHFMGCQYPHDVMIQVQELGKDVIRKHTSSIGNTIQRTLVSVKQAANDKVNKTNTAVKRGPESDGGETSRPVKHPKYLNFVSSSSSSSEEKKESNNEAFILPPLKEKKNQSVTQSSISSFLQGVRNEQEKKEDSVEVITLDDSVKEPEEEKEELPKSLTDTRFQRKYVGNIDVQKSLPFNFNFPVFRFILVLLEYHPEEPGFGVLQRSAAFCNMNLRLQYYSNTNNYRVEIDNRLICEEQGKNEAEARQLACDTAVGILADHCYTVALKDKFTSDGREVDIIDVQDNTKLGKRKEAVGSSNVGHKLLSMMGWEGGGLGKHGSGISEPITAESVFGRQGMGFTESGRQVGKVFHQKIEKIIREYIGTSGHHDLVFTTGFDNPQRAVMHKIARKFGLKSKSFGKGDDRHLTISKKFDPMSLLEELVHCGGETEKFILKPPKNLQQRFNALFR